MKLTSLFKQNAYLSSSQYDTNEDEVKIVEKILYSITDREFTPINIKLIDFNTNYDSYLFESNSLSFCIKFSLDEDCEDIEIEKNNLKKINRKIHPEYISSGKIKIGDNIKYIVTSYEHSNSLNDLGRSYLVDNFNSFCHAYSTMQESENLNNSLDSVIDDLVQLCDFQKNFSESALKSIDQHTDLNKIIDFVNEIKNDLLFFFNKKDLGKNFICHGNLKLSTILSKNNSFKFINFEKAFQSHCFLDFTDLIIELGLNRDLEIKLYEIFCKNMKIDFNQENSEIYKICYQISLRKKILQMTMDYLTEIYIYESFRKEKILNICKKFTYINERFQEVNTYNNNRDFIIKMIAEPILIKII